MSIIQPSPCFCQRMEVILSEQWKPVSKTKKNAPEISQHACHNCRRRRLKCDRSIPHCAKCTKRGQDCLGYGQLFRWQTGVASRGKSVGVTFGKEVVGGDTRSNPSSLIRPLPHDRDSVESVTVSLVSLTDPLVKDLDHTSRLYLSYCESLMLWG
jgi:hypothetical protein